MDFRCELDGEPSAADVLSPRLCQGTGPIVTIIIFRDLWRT